ncbi:hypothetical protein ACIQVT_13380 [Streptomyces sp. NPDC100445]|uniref:hypothetical protein n=1 Tax=Streptomyces sp. NPDC100445 TaxID=3366102 RepID=UPI0038148CE1
MILVPGWLWRSGPVGRGVGAGLGVGALSAAFVLVEAGSWPAAAVVLVVLGPFYGIRVARRMGRLWPGGARLGRAERAAAVRATRRGEAVAGSGTASSVVGYAGALRRAAEEDRLRRWVVVLVTGLALALAVYDTLRGTTGELVASWLVVALCAADLVVWPRRRAWLLARAGRAEAAARRALDTDAAGGS